MYLLLAMAQTQLGQTAASRESLARAMDVVDHSLRKPGHLEEDWNDWITIHILLREASTLMPEAATAGEPKTPAWQTALTQAGYKLTVEQQDDGSWDVDLEDQPLADLSLLRGANISRLSLMHTRVADLAPLRGMPLKKLRLAGTKVTDLAPLQNMPLENLQISGTAVSDLSPLRGMPLKVLTMTSCSAITNLEPLAGIQTFQSVILPPNAKNFSFLRAQPNLSRLSFRYDSTVKGPAQTAAEFWAEQDKAAVQP
jgi:hypothetical protein